jgi:hypothetical protein
VRSIGEIDIESKLEEVIKEPESITRFKKVESTSASSTVESKPKTYNSFKLPLRVRMFKIPFDYFPFIKITIKKSLRPANKVSFILFWLYSIVRN